MKVRASVKKICRNCKVVKRNGVVRVICVSQSINKDKANKLSIFSLYGFRLMALCRFICIMPLRFAKKRMVGVS